MGDRRQQKVSGTNSTPRSHTPLNATKPDGTRGRKWFYGRTRAEVAAELARLAKHVDSGAVVPTRSPTLSDYLTYWHAEVVLPTRRPTTVAKYRTAIELYLRPGLGSHHVDKLTVATVQRYLNARRASGDSVAKLEMIKVVLSSALSCAMREELVTRNVAQLVTLPAEPRTRRTAWTAAQARVFLRAAVDDPAYPVFVLALVYGLRRGEIAACWEDVDFSGGASSSAPAWCASTAASCAGRSSPPRECERFLL